MGNTYFEADLPEGETLLDFESKLLSNLCWVEAVFHQSDGSQVNKHRYLKDYAELFVKEIAVFSSCAKCKDQIYGARIQQDGQLYHFGCIDHAAAWVDVGETF